MVAECRLYQTAAEAIVPRSMRVLPMSAMRSPASGAGGQARASGTRATRGFQQVDHCRQHLLSWQPTQRQMLLHAAANGR